MGYEIKQGKYISFRAAGQERFTRAKTLGAAYTEEAIKERIKGVYIAKSKPLREDKKIRLVVDIENSIKAQQSAGYERWAKIHNLKQAAKSMNFLTEKDVYKRQALHNCVPFCLCVCGALYLLSPYNYELIIPFSPRNHKVLPIELGKVGGYFRLKK